MARVLFTGRYGAAAAALCADAAYDGPPPPEPVADALAEVDASLPARGSEGDVVVDTDEWGLPEPVGLCLEEARELVATVRRRVDALAL